jgi:hypothetical protein
MTERELKACKPYFEISHIDAVNLDPHDFKITKLGDWYLMRLFKWANELGLKGKKIKTIYSIREQFSDRIYVDFECDDRRASAGKES